MSRAWRFRDPRTAPTRPPLPSSAVPRARRRRRLRPRFASAALPALLIAGLGCAPAAAATDRAREIQEEIGRLGAELEELSASERGVLGELNRLDALARVRGAEVRALELRIGTLEEQIAGTKEAIGALEADTARTRGQLEGRLRAIYRQGPLRHYRMMLAAADPGAMMQAFRHASAIAGADAALVSRAREGRRRLEAARADLEAQHAGEAAARDAAAEAHARIEAARREKSRLLASIRRDRQVRAGAMEELRRAGSKLTELAEGVARRSASSPPAPLMDFARFRGLLDWPCRGRVRAGFGRVLHPRFRTAVPHDGLDIEASYGEDIRAVFDGVVSYAGWFSGYGLTLLLDHGGGYLSVYTHASVLMVEKGEAIRRGQVIGKVGDTGSLEGPGLYFEIRKDGRPVDPALWLKKR